MKVLVTGATGFLGSHLVKALLRDGCKIIILKRSFSNTWRIDKVLNKLFCYDIDNCELQLPFQQHRDINAIVHTATCYGRKHESVYDIMYANTMFPLQLLELAVKFNVDRFYNTDSFFTKGQSLSEKPSSYLYSYALSKEQFTVWGKYLAYLKKIYFINVRLEHIYGPQDSEDKFVPFIVNSIANNVPEIKLTPGDQKRDFIYIDDVVSAYKILLKSEINADKYQEYEVGSGKAISIRDFAERIHRLLNSKSIMNFGAIPYPENEIMESYADISKLAYLGWKPKVSLEAAIKHILG